MSLRTTQQHVSVLSPGDGKLRVTNQYVEAIGSKSGSLRVTNQYIEILAQLNSQGTSNIGVSHALSFTREQTFNVISNIGISQDLFISPYIVNVISDIGISQEPYQPVDVSPEITHTIGISQSVFYTIKYDVYRVESNLNLYHFADTTTIGRDLSSNINLTQTVIGIIDTRRRPNVTTTINLTQEATRRGTFYSEASTKLLKTRFEYQDVYDDNGNVIGVILVPIQTGLSQNIEIDDNPRHTFNDGSYIGIRDHVSYIIVPVGGTSKSATSTLSLSQTVYAGIGFDSTLSLTQSAIGLESKGIEGIDLSLSQTVGYSVSGTRSPDSDINISHGVGFFVVSDNFCDYKINIGSTNAAGLPLEPSEPTIIPVDQISLAFPVVSPTTTLYFNKPEWGNIHEIYQKRINRKSRGGKRIIFRDSSWRKHEIIKITLIGLTETETINLLTLLKDSAAQPIKYIDHESRTWTVVILNPDEQIVRDQVGNTVSIEMETI